MIPVTLGGIQVSRNPIHANPVSIEKKAQIFRPVTNKAADAYLKEYIQAFLTENKIKTNITNKILLLRLLICFAYSLILFLDIVHLCLYHETFFLNFLIFAAATVAYAIILSRMSVYGYLVKEVKKRPMDPIDNILASQVSGTKNGLFSLIAVFALPVIVLIVCGVLFAKPRFIYERNNMGGYSVRYCSIGLSNEDTIVVPETHNGLPVNEIRGKTFFNMDFCAIRLPSKLTEIRGDTFSGCSRLSEIDIPQSVTRIGGGAFRDCVRLKKITLPSGITEISGDTFNDCSSLSAIEIPEGVMRIGGGAFLDCVRLKEIKLPSGITEISGDTFNGCSSLSAIRIPEGVTRIGGHAFDGCSAMKTAALPHTLETIGASAFRGCRSLEKIDIPGSVREIGQSAFRGCISLKRVYVPASVRSIGPSAFRECGRMESIRIPKNAYIGEKAFKDTYGEIEYY